MLAQSTVDELIELAGNSDNEVCGFILEDGKSWMIQNVSSDPKHGFWMDPQQQINFLRDAREAGETVLGIFHSHPGGNTGLSDQDVRGWHPKLPYRYFVVAGRGVHEWARGEQGDISRIWSGAGSVRSAQNMAPASTSG